MSCKHFHRCAPVLIALCAGLLPAQAVEEDQDWYRSVWDVRVGWSTTPGLTISESISQPSSDLAVLDWEGANAKGNRFALVVINATARERGGWFWGAGLSTTRWNATPTNGYSAAWRTYKAGVRQITDWFHAVELQAGYQYGIRPHDRAQVWLEIAPVLAVGLVEAQTESVAVTGATRLDGNRAPGYEAGLRTGAYLGESGWILGATVAYTTFHSTVVVDTGGLGESELVLRTAGTRFGVEAGMRF